MFLFHSQYTKALKSGWWSLFGVLNVKNRSHQYAELGRLPQETSEQKGYSFIAGLNLRLRIR